MERQPSGSIRRVGAERLGDGVRHGHRHLGELHGLLHGRRGMSQLAGEAKADP
jgi:hypothetical protein